MSSLRQLHLHHQPCLLSFYMCNSIQLLLTLCKHYTQTYCSLGSCKYVTLSQYFEDAIYIFKEIILPQMSRPTTLSVSPAFSYKRLILYWSYHFCRKLLLLKKNDFINYGKQLMKTPMFRAITKPQSKYSPIIII